MDHSTGGQGLHPRREDETGQHSGDDAVSRRVQDDQRLRILGQYNHNNYMVTGNAFYQPSGNSSQQEVSPLIPKGAG